MTGLRRYFSFQGRASRAEWWLLVAAPQAVFSVICFVSLIGLATGLPVAIHIMIVGLILSLPAAWMGLATCTRRLRDRGRPAALAALLLLPTIFSNAVKIAHAHQLTVNAYEIGALISFLPTVWIYVECAFLRSK